MEPIKEHQSYQQTYGTLHRDVTVRPSVCTELEDASRDYRQYKNTYYKWGGMKKSFLFLFFLSTTQTTPWNYGDVHIIGDSHSAYSFTNIYAQSIPPTPPASDWPLTCETSTFVYNMGQDQVLSVPFQIHWISRTMHMIGILGLQELDFRSYNMKDGDFAVLTFGGIDAYHGSIIKQYVLGRELDEITEKLAKNYIEAILENQKLYKEMNIIVVAVTPPCIFEHNRKVYVQRDRDLPFEKFIVVSNRMLNDYLAHYCIINRFIYLDVTSSFEDQNGILRPEMSDGEHHIKPCFNYIIKQKLIDLIQCAA